MKFSPSCDTMVALGSVTASGHPVFAKNSDREPNEAQYLVQQPRATHEEPMVQCTHVAIPQVERTHAFIGSQPWWIWGLEHGINEHGLAVGNEAAWSRDEASVEPGLLGMDYVRIALERATTATEALHLVTALLEEHGQSGSCSFEGRTAYQNSFIFADPTTAWVLETSARHWVARQVTDVASISNVYSIGTEYDLISRDAVQHAVDNGWHDPSQPFSWTLAYTDTGLDRLPSCRARLGRSGSLLAGDGTRTGVVPATMMGFLRDHSDDSGRTGNDWAPSASSEGSLCMHAATAEGFETAASTVAELHGDAGRGNATIWASLASPCMSVFVPLWNDLEVPTELRRPESLAGPDLWWRTETTQRRVERYFDVLHPVVAQLVDVEQAALLADEAATPADGRADLTRRAVAAAQAHVEHVADLVERTGFEGRVPPTDRRATYLDDVGTGASLPTTA